MHLKLIFALVLFASLRKDCSALENCNNAYSKENGYCVPITDCRHFYQIKLYPTNASNKTIYLKSFCNRNNKIICCAEKEIIQKTTTTTTPKPITTTLAPDVIKAKKIEGMELLENYERTCGISSKTRSPQEQNVTQGQYPWMALLVTDVSGLEFICGGSLITSRHVLTAAKCFTGVWPEKVLLGVHNVSRHTEMEHQVETYKIAKVVVHSEYNEFSNYNDIALITLDKDVTENDMFKSHIRPICLNITESSQKNKNITKYQIAGWGFTENKAHSEVLMQTEVNEQTLSFCREQLKNKYRQLTIYDNQICASGETLHDTCIGDFGGPLFSYEPFYRKTRYVLYGITSFGNAFCGARASPAVYTKVSDFINWIAENIV